MRSFSHSLLLFLFLHLLLLLLLFLFIAGISKQTLQPQSPPSTTPLHGCVAWWHFGDSSLGGGQGLVPPTG